MLDFLCQPRRRATRRAICVQQSFSIALNHPCHRAVAVNLAIAPSLQGALDESAQ
jgi:hypothetical protein